MTLFQFLSYILNNIFLKIEIIKLLFIISTFILKNVTIDIIKIIQHFELYVKTQKIRILLQWEVFCPFLLKACFNIG